MEDLRISEKGKELFEDISRYCVELKTIADKTALDGKIKTRSVTTNGLGN